MLSTLRKRMAREESGFTLVELLVVMLILGILAAIAIPSFFAQRDKARDADAKSAARTAQTAMETYATDNGGSYVGATAAKLKAIEPTLNDASLSEPSGLTAKAYKVTVTEPTTTNTFSIERFDGSVVGTTEGTTKLACTTAGKGGCPSSGTWGG